MYKEQHHMEYLGKVSPRGSFPVRMMMHGSPSRSSYVCGSHSSFLQPLQAWNAQMIYSSLILVILKSPYSWGDLVLTRRRAQKWTGRLISAAGLPSSTAKRYCKPSLSRASSSRSCASRASCREGTRTSSMCPHPCLLRPGTLSRSSTMARVWGVTWSRSDGAAVRAIRASVYCCINR